MTNLSKDMIFITEKSEVKPWREWLVWVWDHEVCKSHQLHLSLSPLVGSDGNVELEEDNRERAGACSRDQTDTWKPLVLRIPTLNTKCNVTKVSQLHTSPKLSPTSQSSTSQRSAGADTTSSISPRLEL